MYFMSISIFESLLTSYCYFKSRAYVHLEIKYMNIIMIKILFFIQNKVIKVEWVNSDGLISKVSRKIDPALTCRNYPHCRNFSDILGFFCIA